MDGREGVLLKHGEDWEIRFERRLRHAPVKVWEAIVGPGAMTRWFDETHMPEPLTVGPPSASSTTLWAWRARARSPLWTRPA